MKPLELQEVYGTIEKVAPQVVSLQAMGEKLAGKSHDPALSNINQNLKHLKQRWDHMRTRAEDRKVCMFI